VSFDDLISQINLLPAEQILNRLPPAKMSLIVLQVWLTAALIHEDVLIDVIGPMREEHKVQAAGDFVEMCKLAGVDPKDTDEIITKAMRTIENIILQSKAH
jgi:hypothetical protein